ncbi:helix-turn-helix domain-containing protein [Hallella absiana]|jgi:AraC family transcriptional activator of pobA|uniref:helix-turn-helix domain-containing protein n=1 Tax=Hallella absiana TaxID=2925336 RepID=UPI0021C837C5|nr:helix-turn-helix domain-containing protein [Hallella absiana]
MSTPQQAPTTNNITATANIHPVAGTEPEFILYDDFTDTSHQVDFFIPNRFIVAYCRQGSLSITVNHKQKTTMTSGDLLIAFPRTTLEDFSFSNDLQLMVLSLSPTVINDSLLGDKDLWPNIEFVSTHPKIHLTEEEVEVGRQYHHLYKIYSKRKPTKFRSNILYTLHRSMIYELADMVNNRTGSVPQDAQYSQTDNTFKRFLQLLAQSEGKIRNVSYFARELCITTKYLSHIVKEKTEHSAKQLIDETVANEIRRQLCYTSKTVKEIANDMGFPSLSFFGTYTRKHLNASPANIRKKYRAGK